MIGKSYVGSTGRCDVSQYFNCKFIIIKLRKYTASPLLHYTFHKLI